MASAGPEPTLSLQVRRTFRQPPEKVYAAWTQAEALKRWFGPSDEYEVVITTFDPRPGGSYRLELRHIRGNVHALGGRYVTLEPPNKLVLTFRWESQMDVGETLVTLELTPSGGGTEMLLTHERFPNVEAREGHMKGWSGSLARLETMLES
jgi:uncharacterized protein YndB with AHSA1/START domain